MEKTFVLDTNVLLFDPSSILKFNGHNVYIPLTCIEELDRFKKDQNENGRNARYFARLVDGLRVKGNLTSGVELENGGKLIISMEKADPPESMAWANFSNNNDNLILATAIALKDQGKDVIIISKDINLRVKGDALGLKAEDYKTKNITLDELYTGQMEMDVSEEQLQLFESERFVPLENAQELGVFPNQYITLKISSNERRKAYGRYCEKKGGIVPLIRPREGVWGIHAKNNEQLSAFDALLNDEIKLVSLVGKAGTGKTLLAIAAGLEKTITEEKFTRLLVSRPIQPMGQDIGFLPGDVNEKLAPWMQPIFDNMDFLFGKNKGDSANHWEQLIEEGLLHIEPLTYIRGRSIPAQYLIVDEAQNLSPHEVKTIVTRAGEGTKIILTGDCEQIDSPYLDSINNGLAYCVDRLKEQGIVGHTTLYSGERSELSEVASRFL